MAVSTSPSPDDPRLGPRATMLERIVLLVFILSFIGGVGFVGVGLLAGDGGRMLGGAAACVVAWLGREWLQQRGRLDELVASFDLGRRDWSDEPGGLAALEGEGSSIGRLAALLRELDALERSRGTDRFDPWALQSVRNEIRRLVASDAGLRQLFERDRHVA